jgi:hypothetical protein
MRVTEPVLSVVVTVVDSGTVLIRCLEALSTQVDAPPMEVIVPFDDSIKEVSELHRRFPDYRFFDMGTVVAPGRRFDAFVAHVLYDRRRSQGLKIASGRFIAMLEDRGWPRSDWAASFARLHEQMPHAVIGGAVECVADGLLGRAVYYCDFGRYEPPLRGSDVEYVSDVNICYKRSALELVRPLWESRYQEAEVNWALRSRGLRLLLSDQPRVTEQRGPLRLMPLTAERVHWGRTFGHLRGRHGSRLASVCRAALTPLVPAILLVRHLRRQYRLRRGFREFLPSLPATLLLLICWSLGEALGELESISASRTPRPLGNAAPPQNPGVHHERSC